MQAALNFSIVSWESVNSRLHAYPGLLVTHLLHQNAVRQKDWLPACEMYSRYMAKRLCEMHFKVGGMKLREGGKFNSYM